MAELLVPFLVVPEGVDPKEAIWDLSRSQHRIALSALVGVPTIPKELGEDSPEPTRED